VLKVTPHPLEIVVTTPVFRSRFFPASLDPIWVEQRYL
jgi:hypothetical protein